MTTIPTLTLTFLYAMLPISDILLATLHTSTVQPDAMAPMYAMRGLPSVGNCSATSSLKHPSFKATLTGLRKTVLRKVQICPRLAETKRKNIFLGHMNSRICLGSSRYWLHKFVQITTKTAPLVIFWQPWFAAGTNAA